MVRVSETVTARPLRLQRSLVWKQTNKYMYEDDTPILAKESALRPDLIKEILFSSHLRPKIPAEVIRILDDKLKRTAPGYAPGHGAGASGLGEGADAHPGTGMEGTGRRDQARS